MTIKKISLALPVLLCGAAILLLAVNPPGAAAAQLSKDCSGGYVAFTFDDGPGPNTPAVLQTLQSLNLKATLFVVGDKLDASAANREALRTELVSVYAVQNDTYDHAPFADASRQRPP